MASEAIAQQWARESGVDVLTTRAFQHTGPGHTGRYALSDWAAQLAAGQRTLHVGNLDVARDYLDVRDVVAAYQAVAEKGLAGQVYNVGSGVPRSMRSLLDGLVAAFGGNVSIEMDPTRLRPVDQPVFYADTNRIKADTDWQPTYSIEETLRDLARWWRERASDAVIE